MILKCAVLYVGSKLNGYVYIFRHPYRVHYGIPDIFRPNYVKKKEKGKEKGKRQRKREKGK